MALVMSTGAFLPGMSAVVMMMSTSLACAHARTHTHRRTHARTTNAVALPSAWLAGCRGAQRNRPAPRTWAAKSAISASMKALDISLL